MGKGEGEEGVKRGNGKEEVRKRKGQKGGKRGEGKG